MIDHQGRFSGSAFFDQLAVEPRQQGAFARSRLSRQTEAALPGFPISLSKGRQVGQQRPAPDETLRLFRCEALDFQRLRLFFGGRRAIGRQFLLQFPPQVL